MSHSRLEYFEFLFLVCILFGFPVIASVIDSLVRGVISHISEERRKTLKMKNEMLLEQQRLENEKIRLLNEITIK